jgi:hypothetical protein
MSDSEIDKDVKISKYIEDLSKSKQVSELIKSMQPLDIATCIQTTYELIPKQALVITLNLLRNVKMQEMVTAGTQTNQYPVPTSRIKSTKDNEIPDFSLNDEESDIDIDDITTESGPSGGPENIRASEFPPASRQNAGKWPYDPNTTFIMDPKHKQKRPLMQSADPKMKSRKNLADKAYTPVSRTQANPGDGNMNPLGIYQQLVAKPSGNGMPDGGTPMSTATQSDKPFDLPTDSSTTYGPITKYSSGRRRK